MRSFSIKTKFLVPAVSLVTIGLLVVLWLNATLTRNSMNSMLKESMTLLSESIANGLGGDISVSQQMLSYLSEETFVREGCTESGADKASEHLKSILKNMKGTTIQYINIFNTQGDLMATTAERSSGKVNVKDRDYFKAILEGGKVKSIGKAILSRTTGTKVVILSQ